MPFCKWNHENMEGDSGNPVEKDLVLVGGGHSHVAVLKNFGMCRDERVRITLISKTVDTPYSGMIPGHLAGHYSFEETHLDLNLISHFAGAQFYRATVVGLDLQSKKVLLENRPPVRFDLLSINTGSTPRMANIPGAREHALPIKPIDRFLIEWEHLLETLSVAREKPFRLVFVGGGAAGVEVLLAARHRLQEGLNEKCWKGPEIEFHLVTDSATILPTHNKRVRSKYARIFRDRGIQVHLNRRVVKVEADLLQCEPQEAIAYDAIIWLTEASPPDWIGKSGLETDEKGFLAVNDCLQSLSHPFVFAAGDVASVINHPRPKSGVFAVRQGPPLAENVRLVLANRPPKPFYPQKEFLSLISTGDRYAIASRGGLAVEGKWVWKWKNRIDRRWMRQYQELPSMGEDNSEPEGIADFPESGPDRAKDGRGMRCGGCGGKVGSDILKGALDRLDIVKPQDVAVGLDLREDAVAFSIPKGKIHLQTVDFFRNFINDPFLFGKIAATHCLGDLFAMGAKALTAQAIVTLPPGADPIVEEQLFQVLSGADRVLKDHEAALLGGHTSEALEFGFGMVANGIADRVELLLKSGMEEGDCLLLTKALGIGTLFAANMRAKARGVFFKDAIASMLQSNYPAGECLKRHGATACTDVTGFGLIGHLAEMMEASGKDVLLVMKEIPVLQGALETAQAGFLSSLHPQNLRFERFFSDREAAAEQRCYPLLFDPQTSGGLLASVPARRASSCLQDLREAGFDSARIIGEVKGRKDEKPSIEIRTETGTICA